LVPFQFGNNQLDRILARDIGEVHDDVVKVRIGYTVMEVALNKLLTIAVGGFDEIFRLALRTLSSL